MVRSKFVVLILLSIFGINMVSIQSFASDINPLDEYSFNMTTGEIDKYFGYGGNVEIPSHINGIKVTGIGPKAFSGCSNLTEINIPNTVTYIGPLAFGDCTNLTNIIIPNSVTYIGPEAFSGCTSLKNLIIPDRVEGLGFNVFAGCNFTSLTIPKSIEYFDVSSGSSSTDTVFNGLTIDTIIVEDGTTAIQDFEFYKCDAKKIIIPNSVTSIGCGAFSQYGWESLTIPDSVVSIGDCAFNGCRLTEITIPNGVISIGDYTFANCDFLTSITIPNSVTSISDEAFYNSLKFTITTYPGTFADKYAKSNNIPVKYFVPEDINEDRSVNMQDVILVASHFNTMFSSSNYDIKCDLNNDRAINVTDIVLIAAKFNYTY